MGEYPENAVTIGPSETDSYLKECKSRCNQDCLKEIEPHLKDQNVNELRALGNYISELASCLNKHIADHVTIDDFEKAKKDGYDELPSLIDEEENE